MSSLSFFTLQDARLRQGQYSITVKLTQSYLSKHNSQYLQICGWFKAAIFQKFYFISQACSSQTFIFFTAQNLLVSLSWHLQTQALPPEPSFSRRRYLCRNSLDEGTVTCSGEDTSLSDQVQSDYFSKLGEDPSFLIFLKLKLVKVSCFRLSLIEFMRKLRLLAAGASQRLVMVCCVLLKYYKIFKFNISFQCKIQKLDLPGSLLQRLQQKMGSATCNSTLFLRFHSTSSDFCNKHFKHSAFSHFLIRSIYLFSQLGEDPTQLRDSFQGQQNTNRRKKIRTQNCSSLKKIALSKTSQNYSPSKRMAVVHKIQFLQQLLISFDQRAKVQIPKQVCLNIFLQINCPFRISGKLPKLSKQAKSKIFVSQSKDQFQKSILSSKYDNVNHF